MSADRWNAALEAAADRLRTRACGYLARYDAIYNGRIVSEELFEIAEFILALREADQRGAAARELPAANSARCDEGNPSSAGTPSLLTSAKQPAQSAPHHDMVLVPRDPTELMIDAPRQIILYAETPGRSLEGLRDHLEQSGIEYKSWFPTWAIGRGHLTKAAIAILVYAAMLAAAQVAIETLQNNPNGRQELASSDPEGHLQAMSDAELPASASPGHDYCEAEHGYCLLCGSLPMGGGCWAGLPLAAAEEGRSRG